MMTRLASALALSVVAGAPALAEASNLRAALSVPPETVFSALSADVVRYLDPAALTEARDRTMRQEALSRALLGGGNRPAEVLAVDTAETFAEKSGIEGDALTFLAEIGQPPGAVSIWGFADDSRHVSAPGAEG